MRVALRILVGAPFVSVWFIVMWLVYPILVCVVFAVDNEFTSPREYWQQVRRR